MAIKFLGQILMYVFIISLVAELSHGMTEAVDKEEEDDFDDELYSVIDAIKDESLWSGARRVRSIQYNDTIPRNDTISDNSLWSDLWRECRRKASFSCIRTGVFKYLDKSLDRKSNLSLTDSVFFRSNKNKVNGFCENSEEERENCLRYNEEKLKVMDMEKEEEREEKVEEVTAAGADIAENEADNVTTDEPPNSTVSFSAENDVNENEKKDGKYQEEKEKTKARQVESLGDLSDILYDKGTHFLMTHDTELQLPDFFFGGGAIKIEPKSYFEGDENEEEGALVKIVFKPPPPPDHVVRGRVIHHLKKLFKKKLMHSFMALMLIIKMIKIKLMFLLPMIIGKATAKKLLLKVLLFLIPGLAHLFKLCHYYHMEHAKYHHHHHKIKHHHHHIKVPVPVPVPIHVDHHNHIDGGGYDGPPTGGGYDYPPYPPHSSGFENDYDYSGNQGLYGSFGNNEAHLSSWGLGSSNYYEAGVLDAKNQPAYYKQNEQNQQSGYYYPDHVGSHSHRYYNKLQVLTPKPPHIGSEISAGYDPFYSPIMQKIDKIFAQLGFNDEPCRERLICSMYKTPHRYSPHSNLLSHELSRDSKELQKPTVSNSAVLRFYRYVQAARDGQDKKDCLRLYPSCTVNTE